MPQIGPHQITIFSAILRDAHQRIDLLPHQPGVDARIAAASAWSTDPQDLPTLTQVSGNIATVSVLIDSYRALHQQSVQVIDQFGRVFANTLIMRVAAMPQRTDSPNVWYIRTDWLLLIATRRPGGT